jgi:hypothetical protein
VEKEGGLAGAVRADDRDRFSLFDREADAAEHLCAIWIGEVEPLDLQCRRSLARAVDSPSHGSLV